MNIDFKLLVTSHKWVHSVDNRLREIRAVLCCNKKSSMVTPLPQISFDSKSVKVLYRGSPLRLDVHLAPGIRAQLLINNNLHGHSLYDRGALTTFAPPEYKNIMKSTFTL